MAHYADLAPCGYFGTHCEQHLLAVGWLERGREYRRGGELTLEFWDKLTQVLADPW